MPPTVKSWASKSPPGKNPSYSSTQYYILYTQYYKMTDPIADLLTVIRNAVRAHKDAATVAYSKLKEEILKVMQQRKFIQEYQVKKDGSFPILEIILNPEKGVFELKRISTPGQRIHIGHEEIKKINGGLGVAILSTSKGVMSGEEARKAKIGGELLCDIY